MKSKLHQNKQFILASLIFSIFGTGAAFALPYTPTDQELDPSCAPGATDCYVSLLNIGTSVLNATSGSILFADSSGNLAQDNSNLFFDDTNNRLGIGTNSPSADIEVVHDGDSAEIFLTSYGGSPQFRGRFARGTASSPTAILSNNSMVTIASFGYDGVSFSRGSRIALSASENWSGTNHGSDIRFLTITNGTAVSETERMRISNAGNLLIGNTSNTDSRLFVQGSGSTSSTYTAQFHNSTGTSNSLVVRDDGNVGIGVSSLSAKLHVIGSNNTAGTNALLLQNLATSQLLGIENDGRMRFGVSFSIYRSHPSAQFVPAASNGRELVFEAADSGGNTWNGAFSFYTSTHTGSGSAFLNVIPVFNPTTGAGGFNTLKITPTINQTGTSTGITRGIYLNPTITSAADYRAIESTAGRVIFNSDTASNYNTTLFNDGNNDNRWGLLIQAGADTPSANKWIQFNDGDGTDQGSICYTGGQANICAPSDIRLKQNITDTTLSLNTLLDIKVKDFTYISDSTNTTIHGFIAQELNEVYPSAVSVPHDESTDFYRVSYAQLTPLIIKSIQEINANFTSLDASKEGTLGYLIKKFLEDSLNGLERIFVKEVRTERICIDDTNCLTKDDIRTLIDVARNQNNNSNPSSNQEDNQPEDPDTIDEDETEINNQGENEDIPGIEAETDDSDTNTNQETDTASE